MSAAPPSTIACLYSSRRAGLGRGDERRADIGEVGAHRLGGEHRAAGGDRARQGQRPVEPFADFLDQRERRPAPGMAAGAGGDRDQPVGAFLDRLARVAVVDDVVERDPAPAVDRIVELARARPAR